MNVSVMVVRISPSSKYVVAVHVYLHSTSTLDNRAMVGLKETISNIHLLRFPPTPTHQSGRGSVVFLFLTDDSNPYNLASCGATGDTNIDSGVIASVAVGVTLGW